MKGKVLLTLVAGIALGASAQQPYTPPCSEGFENGLGEFTVVDANNDEVEIKRSFGTYNGPHSGEYYLSYAGSNDLQADEWLISPSLTLKKGFTYEITCFFRTTGYGKTNRVEFRLGTAPEVASMSISAGDPAEIPYGYSYVECKTQLTVPADGDYNLGLHIISDAGQGGFYIDDLSIGEGISSATPVAVTLGTVSTKVVGETLHASFDIDVPSVTLGGAPVSDPVTIKILRDDWSEAKEISAAPGTKLNYVDEDAALKRAVYTVTCVAGGLESAPAEAVSNPWLGTPNAVEGFAAVQNGNDFTLSWEPVTEATNSGAILIPSSVRYTVKCGGITVVDDFEGTSTEYTVEMPETQQAIEFSITARFGSNTSTVSKTPQYIVGNPIAGEFRESFAKYSYTNNVWVVENNVSNAWCPASSDGYPAINPQDGDNGLLKFAYSTSEGLRLYSPLLDLSGLTNPKLKLWIYLNPESSNTTSVEVLFETGEGEISAGDRISVNSGSHTGWTEHTFEIPAAALTGTTRLVLKGLGTSSYSAILIDNITILSYLDHNLAVETAAPVKAFAIGQKVEFPVTVVNKGANDEDSYTVALYADGEKVAEQEGEPVEVSGQASVSLPFTALPKYAGSDVEFRVVLDMSGDGDDTDNEVMFVIPVEDAGLTKVTGLAAESTKESVNLSWNAPEVSTEAVAEEVTESFESWENGAIEPIDGWIFIDADGKMQKGLNKMNDNSAFAAMVIENFTGAYSWDPSVTAKTGTKCLAMTGSYSYGAALDNWVISPEVKGGTSLSFQCRTFYSYSASNTFEVLWSAGGAEAEDFTVIATKIVPAGDWIECTYELPAEAKRFAIHFSGSFTGDALAFDDFTYTSFTAPAVHTGYNLYRNHELIAAGLPAETTSYVDTDAQDGIDHLYHVTALYDKGESAYSESATGKKGVGTAVEEIGIDADGDAEYYSLQGMRLVAPEKGEIVIVRKGSKSFKAIIR